MVSREDTVRRLEAELGRGAVLSDPAALAPYGRDASPLPGRCSCAVLASSEEEVVVLLRVAAELGVPVVPRGAGTGTTGGALGTGPEVVLDLAPMARIVELSEEDMLAVVEPGVLTGTLQDEAEGRGLFYPPDPASSRQSTLGGNVATCAGGLRAVKYGVTRDYVLGLRGVLAGGEVLETGGRCLKDVFGYDLTRLLVGSEGTLMVFTRLVLKLVPRPPACAVIRATFPEEGAALAASDAVLTAGVLPRALEFLDQDVLGIVTAHLGEPMPPGAGASLLVEVDGGPLQVEEDARRVEEALRRLGALGVSRAGPHEERERIWEARRSVSQAVRAVTPAKRSEDLGVPRGRLAETVPAVKEAGRRHGIRVLTYGHAGDANLHCNFLYDPAEPGIDGRLEAAVADARKEVLARGGTVTGEHGVGRSRSRELTEYAAPELLRLYRGIKRVFDPRGLLNPGKLLPAEEGLLT